ncbi:MAG: hypothetical protein KF723_01735 [Rhizobiaceae bacterium]|nr:hypothetical protein [Rhizobiaceae bacterium]
MKLTSWFAGLVMTAMAVPAMSQEKAPEAVVAELFCQLVRSADPSMVRYLVSRPLLEEINAAQEKNDEMQAARPDEKPPLGDGVPYQSYPDYAPVCEIGRILAHSDAVLVTIDYRFPETPDANWSDRLRLVWEDGLLRIDDIRYGPDFANSLRQALKDLFAQ